MSVPFIGYPQVRAHFFTEGKQFVKVGKADFQQLDRSSRIPDDRGRDQILSVTTAKDLKSPAGRWSVTMTGADYAAGGGLIDILRLGDLCVIEMGPDKAQPTDTWYAQNFAQGFAGLEVVMVGSVDEIRQGQSFSPDGRVTNTVTVSGRDFGKYLVDDIVWRDNWNDYFTAILGLRRELAELPRMGFSGTPASIISRVIEHWLFANFNLEFTLINRGGKKQTKQTLLLSEILRYRMADDTPSIPFATTMLSFEGSLWNMFQMCQSAPWYVMHLDVRRERDADLLLFPHNKRIDNQAKANTYWNTYHGNFNSQVCLLYYGNPWNDRFSDNPQKGETGDHWAQLPTRVITDDDVVSFDLGRSNDEVFNVWRVLAEAPDFARNESTAKLADQIKVRESDLLRRFGIRPRLCNTPFFFDTKDPNLKLLINKLWAQLKDWDIHNEHLLNGEIVMKGMAQIKVGDRLWWRSAGATPNWTKVNGENVASFTQEGGSDFYVEGVEQQFTAFTSWTTTVHVTRGQLHRDRGQPIFAPDGTTVRSPAIYGAASDKNLAAGTGA